MKFERGEMGMNGTRRVTGVAILAALCLIIGSGASANAQAPAAGQDAAAPKYTMAEYNAYQACAAEKVPATLIKCLDDFVSKYPNSTLLNYVYQLYSQAYGAQKNYLKVIEYTIHRLLHARRRVQRAACRPSAKDCRGRSSAREGRRRCRCRSVEDPP
jgi:TolA-binding protein